MSVTAGDKVNGRNKMEIKLGIQAAVFFSNCWLNSFMEMSLTIRAKHATIYYRQKKKFSY